MNLLDPIFLLKSVFIPTKSCLFQDTTVATVSLGFLTGGAVNLLPKVGTLEQLPPDAGMPVESEGLCREGR